MEDGRLGDVCTFYRGLTYKKTDEKVAGTAVLRATNIDLSSNKLSLNELKYINSDLNISEDKYLKKNDIIICTASGSKSSWKSCAY